ncbi:hypothetical protein [Desulfamplus magnetovallimortis]|uniref:hypothetical protein n=1 Tax=Desulfamplus magnetovallimortis TaxID=1246637 RepID=UPI001119092D|nr:hypothetical protein [Desulfamplus magnetovallimortis]
MTGFKLNGYCTLSASIDNRSDMTPLRNVSQDFDDPFQTNFITNLDSRLGLQGHYRFSSKLDFVGQTVLRKQTEINFDNSIELAYFAFSPTPELEFRAGRTGYDAFFMSDNRHLGYGYPWVRPPVEYYGWLPLFNVDGMDGTFRVNWGESQWQLRLQIGQSTFSIEPDDTLYNIKLRDIYTVSMSRCSGPLFLKAGYSTYYIPEDFSLFVPIQNGLNQVAGSVQNIFPDINNEATYLAQNLSFKDARMSYLSIGASYDDGNWIAQAEVARASTTADVFTNGLMGYLALGYRIGDWIPFSIYSASRAGNEVSRQIEDWSVLDQDAVELQFISNAMMNMFRTDQTTFSFGIRWDFHIQAALKLQCDLVSIHAYGHGLWVKDVNLADRDVRVKIGTLSLDFIF